MRRKPKPPKVVRDPPPGQAPPVWESGITVLFAQGTAGEVDFRNLLTATGSPSITLDGPTLTNGLSYSGSVLSYDGAGGVATLSGYQAVADDGVNPPVSSDVFAIEIFAVGTEDPSWNGDTSAIEIEEGSFYDLRERSVNFDENVHRITLVSGGLPNGVTLDNAVLVDDGVGGAESPVSATFDYELLEGGGGPDPDPDAESDWEARSSAAGVIKAVNFVAYSSQTELHAGADILSHAPSNGRHVELETNPAIAITGGRCLRLRTESNCDANGGSWGQFFTLSESTPRYQQFAIRMNRAALVWRPSHGRCQTKLANFGPFGSGQVVFSMRLNLGFPMLMTNGAGGPCRYIDGANLPWRNYDRVMQNVRDNGTPAAPWNQDQLIARYGVCDRAISETRDYGYNSSAETGGDPELNYMDNRGFSFPDDRAISAGAVPFTYDEWLVQTTYMDKPNDVLILWVSAYGSAPVKVIDTRLSGLITSEYTSPGNVWSLGSTVAFNRCEFLNYDTPRVAETGYRPDFITYFDEWIVSTNPIKHPGNHTLPDTP